MAIIQTFNGMNILALPSASLGVMSPSSIEWNPQEAVASSSSPFTGQMQTYDWMNSWWEAQVSFPPMDRVSADAWSAFILECRGQTNAFLIGDTKYLVPRGTFYARTPINDPVVDGTGQTGYRLATRGWRMENQDQVLLPGDFIQINYRMYRVLEAVSVFSDGTCIIPIWPNLRDLPLDGVSIKVDHCTGLFRLAANSGNKYSTNVGNYGFTGLHIREAI